MAGLTPEGLVVKTREEALAEMEAAYRDKYGPNIDLDPKTSVDGRRIGIQADQVAQIWDGIQAVHAANDPDAADGQSRDAVRALTGTLRDAARYSTVGLTCTGTPGTALGNGRTGTVTGTGAGFETDLDVVIAAVAAWGAGTFALDALVTRGGGVYRCTTAGNSVSGPAGTGAGISDGGAARWHYLGPGTGAVVAASTAQDAGPIPAVAGSIVTIGTPVAGWLGVINEHDAALGQERELDPALRLRRYDELGAADGGSFEALRAALLAIELPTPVTSVRLFINRSNLTDGDGLPPHTVECLIQGGDDDVIREVIARHTLCTASTYGNTSGTITDSEGNAQTILFSRPTAVPIYVDIYLEIDASKYPADGDAQVKVLVAAYQAAHGPGYNARYRSIMAQALPVAGVLAADGYINTIAAPVFQADIAISPRQLATYDTSRVSVFTTPVDP